VKNTLADRSTQLVIAVKKFYNIGVGSKK